MCVWGRRGVGLFKKLEENNNEHLVYSTVGNKTSSECLKKL